jgi:hypothetical protein
MTKTTIPVPVALVAVAALAAPSAANAAFTQFDLNCGPAAVDIGDSGKNGVVRSHVVRTYLGWRVDHTLASGQTVSRRVQYTVQDLSPAGRFLWGGRLGRNPNLIMYGEVTQANNGRYVYDEHLYDSAQQNKVVMHSAAWCDGADTPIAQSPPPAHSPQRCPPTHGETEPDRPDTDLQRLWGDADADGPDRACLLSSPDDAPPVVASTPPIASPPLATASSPGSDSVPIYPGANGRAAYVDVSLGATPARMLIGTGATAVLVTRRIAAVLIANNEAVLLPVTASTIIADGSTIQEQIISIQSLTIGGHTLHNVIAGVAPDGADMLLGFPVLNQVGRFTIDTSSDLLIFG